MPEDPLAFRHAMLPEPVPNDFNFRSWGEFTSSEIAIEFRAAKAKDNALLTLVV